MNLLKLKTCLDIFLEETKKTDARNANYISELYSFIWLANQNKINNEKNTLHNLSEYLRSSTAATSRDVALLINSKLVEKAPWEYEEKIIPARKIFFGLFTVKEKVKKIITNFDNKLTITDRGLNLIKKLESC